MNSETLISTEELAKRLNDARLKYRLTWKELAAKLARCGEGAVSWSTVTKIALGTTRNAYSTTVADLADRLAKLPARMAR